MIYLEKMKQQLPLIKSMSPDATEKILQFGRNPKFHKTIADVDQNITKIAAENGFSDELNRVQNIRKNKTDENIIRM
jgi:hypothetical protein